MTSFVGGCEPQYGAFTQAVCITIPYRVGNEPIGEGHRHGLLFKIGLCSPRRCMFAVTRLAWDAHRIRGAAVWRVAADV